MKFIRSQRSSAAPQPRPYLISKRIPLIFFTLLAVLALSCNFPVSFNPFLDQGDLAASLTKEMSLDQALALTPEDNRPGIVDQLGPPEAFTLVFEQLNGKTVRHEEWSYFDDRTRIDFMDGTVLWTVEIEALPEATIFASYYDPQSFTAGMTIAEVEDVLSGQELARVDTTDNGIPGGLLLAGDQILLGFDQGQLVYVQTFPLAPEVNS